MPQTQTPLCGDPARPVGPPELLLSELEAPIAASCRALQVHDDGRGNAEIPFPFQKYCTYPIEESNRGWPAPSIHLSVSRIILEKDSCPLSTEMNFYTIPIPIPIVKGSFVSA